MSCKMCDFFLKTKETKEKIKAVNNAILQDCKYKDIEALLIGFKNDNRLTIPSVHFVKKHKANCLSGLEPPAIEPVKSIVQNTKVAIDVNNNQVPDSFKQQGTLDKICHIQEIMSEVLYKQAHYLNNVSAKVTKSDVDSVKSLMDIVLCNYLDFSKIEISSDKNQLNNISIDMLNKVFSSSLVNNNDILDIVKLLFKADFQKENNYADEFTNIEEQLEEIKTTKEYLEYKTNNSA